MKYVVLVDFNCGDSPQVYPFEELTEAQRFMKDLWQYYYDDTVDDDEGVTYFENDNYACMTDKNGDKTYFMVVGLEEPSIGGKKWV